MSTTFISHNRITDLNGLMNGFETGKAQELVSKLKEEVQVLQEEITRTRYALDQRDKFLSECAPQKVELRSHFDSDKWCR